MTDLPTPDQPEPEWQCVCGETDIKKHDLATVLTHIYEMPEGWGREIVGRMFDD
jgi:hypothetical protein